MAEPISHGKDIDSADRLDIIDIMPDLLIRNISPKTHRALKMQAAAHGKSVSQELRDAIERTYAEKPRPRRGNWLDELREKLDAIGYAELELPPRGGISRDPPKFE